VVGNRLLASILYQGISGLGALPPPNSFSLRKYSDIRVTVPGPEGLAGADGGILLRGDKMTVDEIIISLNEERKSAKQQIRIRFERIQEKCKELNKIRLGLQPAIEQEIQDITETISILLQAAENWLDGL